MSRSTASAEIEAALLAAGAWRSLAELQREFPAVPKRTLQRWLAQLVAEQWIEAQGLGRARRYRGKPVAASVAQTEPADVAADALPLSDDAAALQRAIRLPLSHRTPLGYRLEFLQRYQPEQTFYLPEPVRKHLHRLGRSAVAEQAAGTYARQILDRLLIDLSWSSSRLEGNTYTRLDTQNLIEFGRLAEGKDRLQAQMILNHKAAIEMLVEQADEIGFNRYTIQNLHALLAQNLLPDAGAEGRLRRIDVAITGTVFHPLAIPQQIEECFDLLLAKAAAIKDPFEQAFFAMVQIPYLQPFEDVNKRVSRLAANIPLIRDNLSPLSFIDMPERAYIDGTLAVYELNRIELLREVFVWAYERSCRRYTVIRDALPEPDPFRLRYREALIDVIGRVVAEGVAPDQSAAIALLAQGQVEPVDSQQFLALVAIELHQLHEGNIARYRLRPAQFGAWTRRFRQQRPGVANR